MKRSPLLAILALNVWAVMGSACWAACARAPVVEPVLETDDFYFPVAFQQRHNITRLIEGLHNDHPPAIPPVIFACLVWPSSEAGLIHNALLGETVRPCAGLYQLMSLRR